jgi:tetratricopeptide (TPR) repeat protein
LPFDSVRNFFSSLELRQKVVAGLLVALIAAGGRFLIKRIFKRKPQQPPSLVTAKDESSVQVATGDGAKQEISADKSKHIAIGDKPIVIGRVEPGATVNINVFDYRDGVDQSRDERVRSFFSEARALYSKGEFFKAIENLMVCLNLEKDREKLGAINLQIGNCYYELGHFIKAAEFYGTALREARKANDKKGEASALSSIGNTYLCRPASDGLTRGNNVRQAVNNHQQALKIFQKDEYPVDYAMTQNNLGNAYRELPSTTVEEGAENIRKVIQYYKNALEIRKKDKYPHHYCTTSANLGRTLISINEIKEGCYWLKEAYSLKQFLPDQGKRSESIIEELCK